MNQLYNLKIKKRSFTKFFPIFRQRFKLILVDIDGTLTNDSKTVTPKTQTIIKKIQKKIMVSLVSARSRNSADKFIKQLELKNYHILENGAVIIDPKSKPIYKIYLQKEILKKLYKLILSNSLVFNVCVDGITQYFDTIETLNTLPYNRVTRVSIINLRQNQLIRIERLLKIFNKINYWRVVDKSITSSWNIDITSHLASKENALKFLCKLIKINHTQTIGIGDGYNDLPLIKAVFLKIAMGNAVRELKTIADIITPPVSKDGLANALQMINTQLLISYEKQ